MLRLAAMACGLGMAVLMLGPFQGLEHVFGLGDKPAHAIAFFCMTNGLFAVAPGFRRGDIALSVLLVGVLSEVLQALTGRSMSVTDLMADTVGIVVALIPGWIERLRYLARVFPDTGFAEIRALDRRGQPEQEPALDVTALIRSPAIRHRRRRKDRR
jgi:VanZ family protein